MLKTVLKLLSFFYIYHFKWSKVSTTAPIRFSTCTASERRAVTVIFRKYWGKIIIENISLKTIISYKITSSIFDWGNLFLASYISLFIFMYCTFLTSLWLTLWDIRHGIFRLFFSFGYTKMNWWRHATNCPVRAGMLSVSQPGRSVWISLISAWSGSWT